MYGKIDMTDPLYPLCAVTSSAGYTWEVKDQNSYCPRRDASTA